MKIKISQNANGVDVVTIDGLSVSADVSLAILTAVDVVESLQYEEANASWEEYNTGCVGCISGDCDECSEHNQFADKMPF